jgi:hypothetical protein
MLTFLTCSLRRSGGQVKPKDLQLAYQESVDIYAGERVDTKKTPLIAKTLLFNVDQLLQVLPKYYRQSFTDAVVPSIVKVRHKRPDDMKYDVKFSRFYLDVPEVALETSGTNGEEDDLSKFYVLQECGHGSIAAFDPSTKLQSLKTWADPKFPESDASGEQAVDSFVGFIKREKEHSGLIWKGDLYLNESQVLKLSETNVYDLASLRELLHMHKPPHDKIEIVWTNRAEVIIQQYDEIKSVDSYREQQPVSAPSSGNGDAAASSGASSSGASSSGASSSGASSSGASSRAPSSSGASSSAPGSGATNQPASNTNKLCTATDMPPSLVSLLLSQGQKPMDSCLSRALDDLGLPYLYHHAQLAPLIQQRSLLDDCKAEAFSGYYDPNIVAASVLYRTMFPSDFKPADIEVLLFAIRGTSVESWILYAQINVPKGWTEYKCLIGEDECSHIDGGATEDYMVFASSKEYAPTELKSELRLRLLGAGNTVLFDNNVKVDEYPVADDAQVQFSLSILWVCVCSKMIMDDNFVVSVFPQQRSETLASAPDATTTPGNSSIWRNCRTPVG